MNPIKRAVAMIFTLLINLSLLSQGVEQRVSPVGLASVSYKDSYIKITYGQPSKKKREIFGSLVPYNEVWRTGANEATEITFTRDAIIMEKNIPAGTYSLFTIPNQEEWTIILNKGVGLWGSYNYNSKQDLHRCTVPVRKLDEISYETLNISFNERNNLADLNICWDDICVTLPIQFNEPKK